MFAASYSVWYAKLIPTFSITNTSALKKCVLAMALGILTAVLYQADSKLQVRCRNNIEREAERFQASLKSVYDKIDFMKQKQRRLIVKLKQMPGSRFSNDSTLSSTIGGSAEVTGPGEEYEQLRRQLHSSTQELWLFLHQQLRNANENMTEKLRKRIVEEVADRKSTQELCFFLYQQLRNGNENMTEELRKIIVEEVADRKRWLLWQQERLPTLDGHNQWRLQESARLAKLVQRKVTERQNPTDCRAAKKLFCGHDACGLGCSIHHLVYCLTFAFAFERTLIVQMNSKKFWAEIFQPLSDTCSLSQMHALKVHRLAALERNNATQSIYLPLLRRVRGLPVLPYYIPKQLAKRLTRLNGDPYSWWVGQMVKYVLKLQRPRIINDEIERINFSTPIVGIHVRRTDKLLSEASYHDIEEYMSHVEDYYAKLELSHAVARRRVYLATDDINVLKEAILKYPQYDFYGDYSRAQSAGWGDRYTSQGLTGMLVDLHLLSLCDHIVVTFSSNIGRLAYELMQTRRLDAITRFTTLDHMYYFAQNEIHYRKVAMRNKHIELQIGDIIRFNCNNQSSKGYVLRTNATGQIPWYKTEEHLLQYPYPVFGEDNDR